MKQDDFEIIWHRVKQVTGWKKQNDLCKFLKITSASVSGAKKKGVFRDKWAKKIAEEYNTTAYDILYGEKAENQPVPAKEPVTPTDYDNFRISEKIQKTVEILESDTIYRPALAANIDAFHHGMTQEKVVQDQQAMIEANQQEIVNLAARLAILEKSIACATVAPDNYESDPKTNHNGAA